MWLFSCLSVRKCFLQYWHSSDFVFAHLILWEFRIVLLANVSWHMSQGFLFSPLWTLLTWLSWYLGSKNVLSQNSHSIDWALWAVNKWLLRSIWVWNAFKHWLLSMSDLKVHLWAMSMLKFDVFRTSICRFKSFLAMFTFYCYLIFVLSMHWLTMILKGSHSLEVFRAIWAINLHLEWFENKTISNQLQLNFNFL